MPSCCCAHDQLFVTCNQPAPGETRPENVPTDFLVRNMQNPPEAAQGRRKNTSPKIRCRCSFHPPCMTLFKSQLLRASVFSSLKWSQVNFIYLNQLLAAQLREYMQRSLQTLISVCNRLGVGKHFLKGPISKYFRLCRLYCLYSTLLL